MTPYEQRTVDNCPDKSASLTNCIYLAPGDPLASAQYIEIGACVFNAASHPAIAPGSIGFNAVQRRCLRVSVQDKVHAGVFVPPPGFPGAHLLYAEVQGLNDRVKAELNASDVIERLLQIFKGQIFAPEQQLAFELQGASFKLQVGSLQVDVGGHNVEVPRAALMAQTAFIFTNSNSHNIKILGQKGFATTQLFKAKTLNFESLGIGGLDRQFDAIFRRAFASRVFPPSIVQRLGIQHVKGMLLHGPPGTGKTLIARQIGKMLNGKEPKVVNGPEVLSKYVGQAEENIRNLFGEAESEYKEKGDASELHIIIFDEIDAICRQRGSVRDGTATHDTIVNQLLTKIDGVDALNNILLIGMTNRKDMLDEAMLRPGRLEVQIEIGLADEKGRLQILKIHTSRMQANSFLAQDVDLPLLAERTRNFSGAEIEGLVKSAASYALNRNVDINDLHKPLDEDNIKVTQSDFEAALSEVQPAFGANTENLSKAMTHGVIDYGDAYKHLANTLRTLVSQVQSSAKTPMMSVLLEGPSGSGKTALAASAAIASQFPFAKIISPEDMVGYSEQSKGSHITKVFEDAYKSPLSIVILDDIERLLEYVAIGPRFSNAILQVLLVLVKKQPPAGRKLLIIGTSSAGDVLEPMGLSAAFNVQLHVPALRGDEVEAVMMAGNSFAEADLRQAVETLVSLCGSAVVPVKKLLLWMEMARQELAEPNGPIPLEAWEKVLRDLSS
ncbi:N-ethylmaleimide sensitive fusion protein [Scenedesmus sp. NREL 46B-D3]|nr:N-ethylmaleimide sensitive fusion protein [Scenedesmus sp. NREL 46B-D3]